MPIYRTDDSTKWGTGKGSNLTPAEVDNNIYELRTAIDAIIASPPEAVSVVSVSQSADKTQFTFNMSDSETIGPFTLPVLEPRWRDQWEPDTLYEVLDIFQVVGVGLFSVVANHTSGSTFSPTATFGSPPVAVYKQWFAFSGNPPDAIASVITVGSPPTYTLVLGDAEHYLRVNEILDTTITVPTNSTVGFETGTTVTFEQSGAGSVTIMGDVGVTINCAATHTPVTHGQWAVCQVKKVNTDEWTIFGNLVPA